jgi:hypothetical protein
MPTLEDLEHRVAKLEVLFEEVVKEKLNYIIQRLDYQNQRLDQLYEKTERDKAEILTKTDRDKTEILTKTDRDKRELIYWMVGILLGFATLLITAMWALLSFAIRP